MNKVQKKAVAIFFSGQGTNMEALIKASQTSKIYQVNCCITDTPSASGIAIAKKFKKTLLIFDSKEKNVFEEKVNSFLNSHDIDYIALAGFMRILSPEFIYKWTEKILNIHPSLLPNYKGLDTHKRVLDAKESVSGCTVHVVTEKLDDGPILMQEKVSIRPNDTALSLKCRILKKERKLYPLALSHYIQSRN